MKSRVEDLAWFGGTPEFAEKLHVGRPNIGDKQRLLDRLSDMLERRWLTNNGPYVQELEKRICEHTGVKHCIAMCNATVALEIMIRAAGLSGEVLVPSYTFVATAHALQWQQIHPVFCDIDPATHCLDPKAIERMITPRTSGIIGVHCWGRPCAIDELTTIAAKHGLTLLFDAAHAFGCSYHGRMIGNFGLAEVLSFHATKFLNAFEGGAVLTNDDALAAKVRLMKNFGFAGYDRVIYIGTNGKMTEPSAAMALTNLESMQEFVAINRQNHQAYARGLSSLPGVSVLSYDAQEHCNYQYVVVELDEEEIGLSRDQFIEALHAENILARRYFYPGCHRMEPYRSYFPHAGLLLPQTERVANRVLVLPTGSAVGDVEIGKICRIVRTLIENAQEIRERLSLPAARKPRTASAAAVAPTPVAASTCVVQPPPPKVSVCMVTYRQERFIAQAIESVLMQRTNFPFELVIGEDCSPDKTRDIVTDYARRYPDRIRLVLPQSNLGSFKNLVATMNACRGQYIAFLDGDDFWIHPQKLQKQADFLDAHSECAVCYTPINMFSDEDGSEIVLRPTNLEAVRVNGLEELLREQIAPVPCGTMLRKSMIGAYPDSIEFKVICDFPLHVLTLQNGKMGYLDCVMAAYRSHRGGTYSGRSMVTNLTENSRLCEELDRHLQYRHTRLFQLRLGGNYFGIAYHLARTGDTSAAKKWLWKSASKRIATRDWSQFAPTTKLMLRLYAPKLHRIGRSIARPHRPQPAC